MTKILQGHFASKTLLPLARVIPELEQEGYRVAYTRMLGDPTAEVKAVVRGVPTGQLAYADRGRRLVDLLVDALPLAGRLVAGGRTAARPTPGRPGGPGLAGPRTRSRSG